MNATTDPYVSIRSLTKVYGGPPALDAVDLDIAKGECVTLLGPSGSGKSTLLKLLAGFEPATSGTVVFDGEDITTLSPAERECGMVFQNYALFPHLTVAANIEYGLKIRRWSRERRRERVEEMLQLVGLNGFGDRRPSQLSGGQQQRVAIARALAYHPPLLLMDEPLGALDRSLRLELVEQIRRIHRETGTTLVYVTHDQQEALALSDRIAIMRNARIVECDTPERLYRQPQSDFVATFFGDANLLEASSAREDDGIRISAGGGSVVIPADPERGDALPNTVALRPRAFRIAGSAAADTGDAAALTLRGTLQDTLFLGDETELIVRLSTGQQVKALVPALAAAGLDRRGDVTLSVGRDNVIPLGTGVSQWTRAIETSEAGAVR
ncbi:ABC transporter ATP-binding protein [Leucobacter celer]|uniref:ABC transporter ATP-binding protein n=1 Tax=Leucobacter celer TaxID=668625 RepID=UPI0006A766F1|nr:ABC transporter ATP-binding protein [Leucobacter celer]